MPLGYIPDGYTRDGYIAATDDTPALTFQYRPPLHHEKATISRKIAEADRVVDRNGKTHEAAAVAEKMANTEIAKRITEWDLQYSNGSPVPVTPDEMNHVHPALLARLLLIVVYWAQSDPRPQEQPDDGPEQDALEREAAETKN